MNLGTGSAAATNAQTQTIDRNDWRMKLSACRGSMTPNARLSPGRLTASRESTLTRCVAIQLTLQTRRARPRAQLSSCPTQRSSKQWRLEEYSKRTYGQVHGSEPRRKKTSEEAMYSWMARSFPAIIQLGVSRRMQATRSSQLSVLRTGRDTDCLSWTAILTSAGSEVTKLCAKTGRKPISVNATSAQEKAGGTSI